MLIFENHGIPTNATHHARRVERYRRMERRTWILSGISGGLMLAGIVVGVWVFVAVSIGVLL